MIRAMRTLLVLGLLFAATAPVYAAPEGCDEDAQGGGEKKQGKFHIEYITASRSP